MQVGFFQSNLALASDWQPASEADQSNPAITVTVNKLHACIIGDYFWQRETLIMHRCVLVTEGQFTSEVWMSYSGDYSLGNNA